MTLPRDRFWWTLFGIGTLSVALGGVELGASEVVLHAFEAEATTTSTHLLSMIGAMTAMFGLMFLYAITSTTPQPLAVLWSGLQKCGTSALFGLGVQRAIFCNAALAVAIFDLIASVMILGYWYWVRQLANESQHA
jgi:hypothetical protein